MPAGLDRNDETGEAAVAAVGGSESMWHQEGVEIPEDAGLELALRRGGLDWAVEKRPVYFKVSEGSDGLFGFGRQAPDYQQAPSCYVVIRRDRMEVFGQVGETYTPLQNRDAFGVLEPMIDAGLARIETCGSLRGGKDVWMLVRFDEQKMLGEIHDQADDATDDAEALFDEVRPFGLITNNHAGQRKVTLKETPVRVVCMNTLSAALSRKRDMTVEVVHSSSVKENVETAAKMLFTKLSQRYGTIGEVRRALKDVSLDKRAHSRLVLDPVAPVKHLEEKIRRGEGSGQTEAALEKASRKRREIRLLWVKGEGHEGDLSAWEALNGLVQALDHSPTFETRSDSSRVKSAFRGKIGKSKDRVTRNLLKYAEADEDERPEIVEAAGA